MIELTNNVSQAARISANALLQTARDVHPEATEHEIIEVVARTLLMQAIGIVAGHVNVTDEDDIAEIYAHTVNCIDTEFRMLLDPEFSDD